MCDQAFNTAGRRLPESRTRENLMSGSMWQGMETRIFKSQAPSLDRTSGQEGVYVVYKHFPKKAQSYS